MISLKNILIEQSNSNTDWAPSIQGIHYHQKNTSTNKAQSYFDKNPGALTDPNLPVKDRYADFDVERARLAKLTARAPYAGTSDEDKWLDNIQNIADWIGIIPVIGDIVDVMNSIVYFIRGKYAYALLSIVAMIPVVGTAVSLPLKAAFKLVGPILNVIFQLIRKGAGTKAAQQLITSLSKVDKQKTVELISVFKPYTTKIKSYLQPINNKFDKLRTFNSVLVPNFLIRRINSMANACFPILKGTTEFLTEIAETNLKDVIPKELALSLPVMKQLYTDKSINKWLKTLTPTEFATIKSKVLNGTYKFNDVSNLARKSINPDYAISQGIKFSVEDIEIADLLAKAAKSKGLMKTKFVSKTPKNQSVNVTMEVIDVKNDYPELWNRGYTEAWAEPTSLGYDTNKIIFDINFIKQNSSAEIESIIVHELAHIKDPSFKSPKLLKRYQPRNKNLPDYTSFNLSKDPADAGKSFWNTYYLHPFEVNAITPQVLGHMVKTTKQKGYILGKQKTLDALDQIENWTKGVDVEDTWTQDAADILGYSERADIETFFDAMRDRNPAGYKKLRTQIAKQVNDLKIQTNKLSEYIYKHVKLKNLL